MASRPDSQRTSSGRSRLMRIGGLCLIGAGAVYATSAVLSLVIGAAPSAAEPYLRSVSQHLIASGVNFALWDLADVLLVPAALALYFALRDTARRWVLASSTLLILFAVWDLVVTESVSLRLVFYAQHYSAATEAATRLATTAAASHALAILPVATLVSYAVSSIGLLIASIVWLRAGLLRVAGLAGIVGSVAGLIGGLYFVYPSAAVLLVPSLIAFALWAVLSGWQLHVLGRA